MTLSAIYPTTMAEHPPPPPDHCDDASASDQLPRQSRHESRPSPPPPRRVNHTYRDFSRFEPLSVNKDRRASSNFPAKLHMMLSNPEHSHVICWMPHGRAWKILNKELLVSEVIPQYFVQTKYESFTRQLSGWGFKRLHQSGPDFRAYYHECFLRGLPHLTQLMKRVPANLGRLIPHVEGEPNFYEMSQSHPLPREDQPFQSTRLGSGSPPAYPPPRDVTPPHSDGSSGSHIGPPPPPPNSYYGTGYPPPPSPPSHGANSCAHSRSPESSYASSYSAPYGENHYTSYHAPSALAPYYEQTGYYGHSHQNPPPFPYFYYGPPRLDYPSTMPMPAQYPLAPYAPDPFHSSSSRGGSPMEPLPFAPHDFGN